MDSSNSQHNFPQEMSSETLESMLVCTMTQQEKKPKPAEEALPCPRCESINTKFCYYNNYSLTQPRYFCKSCRRYWTKGGTLRNVPVGGGCRKAKRSSSKRILDQPITSNNQSPCVTPPLSSYDSTDLSLAFARLQEQTSGHYGFNNLNMSQNFNGIFVDESNYGGYHNSNTMNYGMGMAGISQELGFEETVKQELCTNGRVLRGFPWSGASNYIEEVDSGRLNSTWNGMGFSNWHGLLNSPLV